MDARTPWDAGDVVDGFQLGRRLARGGMADLFIATPLRGGERVVLKAVREDFLGREEIVRMFEREASLLTMLQHPNIVRVDAVRVDGTHSYIAMEYIDGRDLREVIRAAIASKRSMPIGVAVRVALDVLSGLESAHRATTADGEALGLVHRDVSPSNIMLTRDGCTKLVDFGIAKQQLATPTSSRVGAKGKGSYMAPEQCKGLPIDARVDVYAIGAVLYELLTLERPFQGANDMAVLHAILEGDKRSPVEVRDDIPAGLEQVILRALEMDPADRFPTASAMAEALETAAKEAGIRVAGHAAVAGVVETFEPPPLRTIEQSLSALRGDGVNHSQPLRSRLESSDQTRMDTSLPGPEPRPSPWRSRLAMAAVGLVLGLGIYGAWPRADAPPVSRIPVPKVDALSAHVVAEAPASSIEAAPPQEVAAEAAADVEAADTEEVRPRRGSPRKKSKRQPDKPKSVRLDDELRPPTF